MVRRIAFPAVGLVLLASPLLASADLLSDLQVQVQALMQQIAQLQAEQGPSGSATGSGCYAFTQNLYPDVTDAMANGEVSRLQEFLIGQGVYPEAFVTGYFGPATTRAVQAFQAREGIVSSGDPDSSGYGYVGPRTRAAIARICGASSPSGTVPAAEQLPHTGSEALDAPQTASESQASTNTGVQGTGPTSVTIDSSSLTSTVRRPTITGSASGLYSVEMVITTQSGAFAASQQSSAVQNGRWSLGPVSRELENGTYNVEVRGRLSGEDIDERTYARATLVVNAPAPSTPPTVTFSGGWGSNTASNGSIGAPVGQTVVLWWNASNVTSCSMNGQTYGGSGNVGVTSRDTPATYTLMCTGGGGSTSASITVHPVTGDPISPDDSGGGY